MSQLLAASDKSSLESVYEKPWHMVVEMDFPARGKQPAATGTIERWQDNDKSRTVLTVGPSKATYLAVDDKQYSLFEGPVLPDAARDLRDAFLHPGPSPHQLDGVQPELQRRSFGKTTLNCIMLDRAIPPGEKAPLGLFRRIV